MLAKMTEMEMDERFTALERTVQRIGSFEEKMEELAEGTSNSFQVKTIISKRISMPVQYTPS